ncbi:MAG TPA: NAD-dependent epimerase/dehydratase family protein [Candidatus Paceibacterota bacterium]|nr:NAD-dependent epimerase/dehydratase family protein [Candidatus Paceibacterota bacterium]
MKTYIVTGGAGFIGSHLADLLVQRGERVVVVDNLSTGKKQNLNRKAKFLNMDIRSPRLGQLFLRERPHGVFHLAAIPRVPISVEDPVGTSDVNITGTVNVFWAAKKAGVKRVVFASSSSVYGSQKNLPLHEAMQPKPVSPYGLQKLMGEQWARVFFELYGLPIVSLRYFNVYGPRIDFDSDYGLVIGKFLWQFRQKKPLTIFGTGNQTRAFCYVDDVAQATVLAMQSLKLKGADIINVGGEESHSINHLAALLGGQKEHLPPRPGDVEHTKADTKAAKRLLGWEQTVSLKEGVRRTAEWFKQNG